MDEKSFFIKAGENPKLDALGPVLKTLTPEEKAAVLAELKAELEAGQKNKYGEVSAEEMKDFDGTQYKTLEASNLPRNLDVRGLTDVEGLDLPKKIDDK